MEIELNALLHIDVGAESRRHSHRADVGLEAQGFGFLPHGAALGPSEERLCHQLQKQGAVECGPATLRSAMSNAFLRGSAVWRAIEGLRLRLRVEPTCQNTSACKPPGQSVPTRCLEEPGPRGGGVL